MTPLHGGKSISGHCIRNYSLSFVQQSHCNILKIATVNSISMTGIDSEGFDVLADNRKLRIDFDTPINTVERESRRLHPSPLHPSPLHPSPLHPSPWMLTWIIAGVECCPQVQTMEG
jgi:uncharacterized protein DUF2470